MTNRIRELRAKLDLSQLFGAPEGAAGAVDLAARERDANLFAAGREAVGPNTTLPGHVNAPSGTPATDKLDQLLDQLDELDL